MIQNTNIINYRPATPQDKIPVAKLMVQAMDDLARKFINSNDNQLLYSVFEKFVAQKENIYSFENTIVGEDNDSIVGSITGYDGGKLVEWRKPFIDYIKTNHCFDQPLENETSEGEFYIDTVSVAPDKQGLGIGKELISKIIEHAQKKGHKRIGLLVGLSNPGAKKLYLKLGFVVAGIKPLLDGHYEHLILEV